MTTLVVNPLKDYLDQNITVEDKAVFESMRLLLYKHLSPAGEFRLEILYPEGGSVIASATLTSALMEANATEITSTNYAHGWFRFDFGEFVTLHPASYTLRLIGVGYSFSENAYIGWIQEHEDLTHRLNYTPENDFHNPLSYQGWSF